MTRHTRGLAGFLVGVLMGFSTSGLAQPAATTPAQDRAERELKMLAGQLSDPTRTDKTKLEAAELLLIRSDDRAAEILLGFLAPQVPPNPRAQIAVAEAIARAGTGRKEFVDPLMTMLTGTDETVRGPAARALATYKDQGVLKKLIDIARSDKQDKAVRLATISAFRQVLDKRALGVLVKLLDDGDADIAAAAGDTLAKITNISAFRTNKELAKRWLRDWGSKRQSVLIAQLADSLARANSALETQNEILRKRLRKSLEDLYAARPAELRQTMLAELLNDALGDVRLVGATLTERRIAANEPVSEEARNLIRRMLGDEDVRCRQAAARLVAALGDTQAVDLLLVGLKTEESPAVRRELFSALGKLPDSKSLPVVLDAIRTEPDSVVTSAATALTKIAAKQPLTEAQRKKVIAALTLRYQEAGKLGDDGLALRGSLLGALGAVGNGQKDVATILVAALDDPAATVRLAAVNAVAQTGRAGLAADVAKHVDDPDRGVRTVVLAALASLGGRQYLDTLLARALGAEQDNTVRRQAWTVILDVLRRADAAAIEQVLTKLGDRKDVADQRIRMLELLVATLRDQRSKALPDALRRQGMALAAAGRPAEAATALAEAYGLYVAAGDERAAAIWVEWIDTLFKAGDVSAVTALAEQKDKSQYEKALTLLVDRLQAFLNAGAYPEAIRLATAAGKTLDTRLTDAQRLTVTTLLSQAKAAQAQADAQRVAELLPLLWGTDEMARASARAELAAMGARAVARVLAELRKVLEAKEPPPLAEKALLDLLTQIAPALTGYDMTAAKAERLKRVKGWMND